MKTRFELSQKQKDEMIDQIQTHFSQEKGEEIGNLEGMLWLDFFIEKLAPYFYNLGIEDSHTYMLEKIEDLFEIQK